ncbi:MAG: Asp-tRNA(Asn)/Glu-tRNA(Gln) amidotransferase subunit GatA [Chloroflexota bacterium]|jgi:aspartyl-tRNA(Asn)/glutamyl-tRNA(Gln) amidotransferase subunit A|nr:Asp-tRNA(Asn)/Glu-tRNA(Gln) amidotransferase subunit GatA [Chloroflexota bacterium]
MTILDNSAFTIAERIRAGDLSTVKVLEAALERIVAVDGRPGSLDGGEVGPEDKTKVHAFITLTEERARKQAELVDSRVKAGKTVGPLTGVPITVKDIFCVKDTLSTAASRILADFTAPYSATVVERLEAAGALILGKVNLDEFTYGSSTESSAFQPSTRNPWDTERVPGGSSGGSTASVAAGETLLSLGTDTAGSIRQPAAFCGVVGLKPTYGRVSRYGLIAFGSSLDCPGPVARDVRDAALMLSVIAGADRRDSTAARVPVPDYLASLEKGVEGLRIGLSPDYLQITFPDPETGELVRQELPDEIREATLHAAEVLAKQGAEIVENVPMPNTKYGIPAYFVISRVEAASNLHRYDGVKYGYRTNSEFRDLREMYCKTRTEGFGLQPKLRILMGMYVSAAQYSAQYYQRALRVRSLIRSDFDAAFDPEGAYRVDALLTPTTPTTAFRMGDIYGDSVLMQYADQLTVPANHAGIPGISIPGGLSDEGLPIGIQLLAPDFMEETLFRVGYAFEQATADADWRRVKPQVLREE